MTAARWTRKELATLHAYIAAHPEETAATEMLCVLKVTPHVLEEMLGGTWTSPSGVVVRFDGIEITEDGFTVPVLTTVKA